MASLSSPVKSTKSKKLPPVRERKKAVLPTVSENLKQASIDSPEREKGTIAQVVTETKQNKTSIKEEAQSTGSDSTDLSVTQVDITINLPSMADSRLNVKLKHLLTTYFLAIGNNHEARQMFKENDFYDFEEFNSCDKQALTEIKRKKNNVMVGFNN